MLLQRDGGPFNRRFSSTDKDRRSPKFGKIARAGKVYIPPDAPPKPVPPPDIRKVSFWCHVAYQDGLIKQIASVIGATGTAANLIDGIDDFLNSKGVGLGPSERRLLTRARRFAKPILKVLKYAGWAGKAVDWILRRRVVTGYLVMTYDKPFDTHYSWKVNLALHGDEPFGGSEGEFSTRKDAYTIRTSVFDPTKEWDAKDLSCTFAFNSFALTVKKAFKKRPNDKTYRAVTDRVVMTGSGPLDLTLNLQPLTKQVKFGFFTSFDFIGSGKELTDGRDGRSPRSRESCCDDGSPRGDIPWASRSAALSYRRVRTGDADSFSLRTCSHTTG